jgi:glycosyltransferase involved in cell wall biosynthesis
MHVLFIPSWYPASPSDPFGCFFREQALALRSHGMNVGVITPAMRSLTSGLAAWRGPFGITEEMDEGMPTLRYHGVRLYSWNHALNMRFWERCGLRAFDRYRARYGMPDLLHVHGTIFGLAWASAIQSQHGVPFVVTEHSSEFTLGNIRPRLKRYLVDRVRTASRCFAVSVDLSERLSRLMPTGATPFWEVMPNLVASSLAPAPPASGSDGAFTLLNVAGMHPNKGQHHLLRAFAFAIRLQPEMRLRIVGGGPEAKALERLTRDLGISEHVTFLGMCSRERVAQEMALCNTFVLSSSYETFGVVVVEALMNGRPVVATRCGGPEDIIVPGEDGLLVEKDNPKALAAAMLELRAQRDRFDAAAIRQRCIDRFGEAAFARRHAEVYQAVLSSSRSSAAP